MVKSYMIYGKMSIELNDKFSQKYVNNLAGLLKLKFLHNTQKDLDFIENLIILRIVPKKFLGYTMFRVKKEIKQAIKQQLIHKSYSSAMTSSCFHIHENKKHGGFTIC